MKVCRIAVLAVCGMLAALSPATFAAQTSLPASPDFSARVNEVVKLAKSDVNDSVIIAYVRNSPGLFQPSADDILKLRDLGISSQVITAMLERDGELRRQAPAPQVASAYPQPAPAPEPVATYVAQPTYTGPSSSVVYIGGSYAYPSYGYPYYSYFTYPYFTYSYGWPYYYGPRYSYPRYGYYPRAGFYGRFGHGGFAPRFSVGVGFGGGRFGGGFHGGFRGGITATRFGGGGFSGHLTAPHFSGGARFGGGARFSGGVRHR